MKRYKLVFLLGVALTIATLGCGKEEEDIDVGFDEPIESIEYPESEINVSPDESEVYNPSAGNYGDNVEISPSYFPMVDSYSPKLNEVEIYFENSGYKAVPTSTIDGKSFEGYFNSISLSDLDSFFGGSIPSEYSTCESYTLVGTSQIKNGDLMSVGWLINNLNNLSLYEPVYFTDLHVIGSLSDERVILLCCYNWYSSFGLQDTLVILEDISGTLSVDDFEAGDIVSTVVFPANMKTIDLNGYTVVHAEYATFE